MEIVDNAILLLWPGAMEAGLGDLLFWGPLAIALAVAWGPTFLVNRALIARGKGHAVAHAHHGAHCTLTLGSGFSLTPFLGSRRPTTSNQGQAKA